MALTLSLRKRRNRREASHYGHDRHAAAEEAVRGHLDNVEIGSPLLYPF